MEFNKNSDYKVYFETFFFVSFIVDVNTNWNISLSDGVNLNSNRQKQ